MKRIDTATKAVDLFGAGKHGFKDGNKALGIAATDLDASLFNNVQEEICRVIEAAGIGLDGAVYNQLLLALRAAGVFTTPAQFDNTTKAAPTEFVQRALGSKAEYRLIGATTILTAADVGKALLAQGSAMNITLPLLSSVVNGAVIEINSQSSNSVTVLAQGADVISINNSNGSATSMTIGDGETLQFVRVSAAKWAVLSGSAALKYAAGFGVLLGVNGYQKLPSGIIIQWGTVSTNASGLGTITFPIAFPNAGFSVSLTDQGGTVSSADIWSAGAITTTSVPVASQDDAGAAVSTTALFIAIGW